MYEETKGEKMKFEEIGEAIQERISQLEEIGEGVSIKNKDVAMAIFGGVLCMGFIYGLITLVMWGI
ncbi:hypothetical protein ES703_73822 [subsurface metagenome]